MKKTLRIALIVVMVIVVLAGGFAPLLPSEVSLITKQRIPASPFSLRQNGLKEDVCSRACSVPIATKMLKPENSPAATWMSITRHPLD